MKIIILLVISLLLTDTALARSKYSVRTYIPTNAYKHMPTVKSEVDRLKAPVTPWYISALIGHESCIGLRHSRCWSPRSELKNSREHGVGLGQITRAWRSNGSLRFDRLTEMVRAHNQELRDLTWRNVKSRPDLQIRAIILMVTELWDKMKNTATPLDRLYMVDSSYNGGFSSNKRERTACRLKKGCDQRIWLGNVARMTNAKSTLRSRYGRSFWEINRFHVADVVSNRQPKYKKWFEKEYPDTTSSKPETVKPVIQGPKQPLNITKPNITKPSKPPEDIKKPKIPKIKKVVKPKKVKKKVIKRKKRNRAKTADDAYWERVSRLLNI